MDNADIARVLDEIGDLLDLQDANGFRIRAYRNAAETIRGATKRIDAMVEAGESLSKLPGIGKSTAAKILEILETGTCERLEELRKITPSGLIAMTRVPGLGPKKVMAIYETLGISTVEELAEAAENGELAGKVPGLAEKSEAAIAAAIETFEEDTTRVPLRAAMAHVRALSAYLDEVEGIVTYEVAGSFRRGRETVHDLDFLLQVQDRDAARGAVLDYPDIRQEIVAGNEKASVRLMDGMQVDFRFVDEACFGSALMYFTGSKAHNIELRKRAIERGWKLSEYGLFEGDEIVAARSEADVYAALDLPWIPPELREDTGELLAAEDNSLPLLVEHEDLLGDLHLRATGEAMRPIAMAAMELGYRHVAFVASDSFAQHLADVRALDAELDLRCIAGAQVGIDDQGRLRIDEDLLDEFEWVLAHLDGSLGQSEAHTTERFLNALERGGLHCLAHPLGHHHDPLERVSLDLDRVLRACASESVCVEIDPSPHLLERADNFYRVVQDTGVELALGSRATTPDELWAIDLCLATARRAQILGDNVHNRWTWD